MKQSIKYVLCVCMLIYANSSFTHVLAAERYGIVATVNDEAISSIALRERLQVAIVSSGLPDTAEVRAKLLPQVVQLLIDEALLEQEAAKRGISIDEKDVNSALESVAVKNNITMEQLPEFFQQRGISLRAVKQQVRAQVVKVRVVGREVRPDVSVTDQEVEEKMENIASQTGKEEYHLSEIVLPVDTPEDEGKITKLAEKLYEELQKGSDFKSVAREFSRSSTAASGGELGWLVEDSISRELRMQVGALKSGQVSKPLRLADGYHIMRLNDRRAIVAANQAESEVGMRQIFVPAKAGATEEERQAQFAQLEQQKAAISGCEGFGTAAEQLGSTADSKMVMTQLKNVKEEIRNVLSDLPVGVASPIVKSEQGFHVFMVCERINATPSFVQPARVRDILEQQKLELHFRRFVQDLRRDSFVEIRI